MQAMRLAELRDLEFTARHTKERAYLEAEFNAGSRVASQEPEEELEIGHASKYGDAKEPKQHNGGPHGGSESSEEDGISDDWDELAIDTSTWPLLYRIMNADPDTSAADMEPLVHG
jgi:hypothetical protein